MTPSNVVLLIAVLSFQVMQILTQHRSGWGCGRLPKLQDLESIPPWVLSRPLSSDSKPSSSGLKLLTSVSKPPSSVINSQSSVQKPPSPVTKLPFPVTNSPSLVPKSPTPVPKSPYSVSKLQPSDSILVPSESRLPPESLRFFKVPVQFISRLLSSLLPPTIRQNTSSVVSPSFSFYMPLTFSTIQDSKKLPCNSPRSCNLVPYNTINSPKSCDVEPCSNTNNSTNSLKPQPCNTNSSLNCSHPSPGNTGSSLTFCATSSNNTTNSPTTYTPPPININNVINDMCSNLLAKNNSRMTMYLNLCNLIQNKVNFSDNGLTSVSSTPTPIVTPTVTSTIIVPTDHTPPDEKITSNTPVDTPINYTPVDNTQTDISPAPTTNKPISPCFLSTHRSKIIEPGHKIRKMLNSKIFEIPCRRSSCPITHTPSHAHVNLKAYTPHHTLPLSNANSHSVFNPLTYKSNYIILNPQEELILKMIKNLTSTSNVPS